MKKLAVVALALCLSRPAFATDAWTSEISHFGGGILIGGAATWLADQWRPEDRLWIGIGAGVVAGAIGEGVDAAKGYKFSWLDFACDVAGAAVGSFVTDRWILAPVVTHDRADSTHLGLQGRVKF